ncbi:hypothetical protein CB1_000760045 [Camelus ferus]|nr:hypothetical protein CB1_000760045 [Camelus ferus]
MAWTHLLLLLLSHCTDSSKHQGSGVQSHFSGSRDASANAGLLLISGLQPEDEAITALHIRAARTLTRCPSPTGKHRETTGLKDHGSSEGAGRGELCAPPTLVFRDPQTRGSETSPSRHQVTLGREREEADLHEAPSPLSQSGREEKARGPHSSAQDAEELHPGNIPTMASMVLLLGLLAHGSEVDSKTVVTQEPSLSVSPGGTVTFTCGLSPGSVTISDYHSWYQQTPGQAP